MRERAYYLDRMEEAEYILADFHQGISSNHFFGPDKMNQAQIQIQRLQDEGLYQVIYQKDQVILLKRAN
jgi:hypothetical protein